MSVGILILAAGESKRLGQPKQLLPFRGTTLLRHAAETALSAQLGPVIVVLGPYERECRDAFSGHPVSVVTNPHFAEGMGSTIACGVHACMALALDAAIITLCDLPHVTSATFRSLRDEQARTSARVVAARFDGTLGAPALFTAACFPRLLKLPAHAGAKALIAAEANVAEVHCPEAAVDVDTWEDFRTLSEPIDSRAPEHAFAAPQPH